MAAPAHSHHAAPPMGSPSPAMGMGMGTGLTMGEYDHLWSLFTPLTPSGSGIGMAPRGHEAAHTQPSFSFAMGSGSGSTQQAQHSQPALAQAQAQMQIEPAFHLPCLTGSPPRATATATTTALRSGSGPNPSTNPLKRQLSFSSTSASASASESQKDGHRRVEQNRRHDLTMLFNELAAVLEARRPDGKGVPPKRELLQLGIKKLRALQAREEELEQLNDELRTDRNWLRGQIDSWRRQATALPASPSPPASVSQSGGAAAGAWTPSLPSACAWSPALGADCLRTSASGNASPGAASASASASCARAASTSSESDDLSTSMGMGTGGSLHASTSASASASTAVFRALSEVEETKRKLQALLALREAGRRASEAGSEESGAASASPQGRGGQSPVGSM